MNHRLLISVLALVAFGCRLSPTLPIDEIVGSDLPDRKAHREFADRVRELSKSKRALSDELRRAGFRFHSKYGVGCGVWIYPVANPNDPKALRANVKTCQGLKSGEVEVGDTDFQHWPDRETDAMQSVVGIRKSNSVDQ